MLETVDVVDSEAAFLALQPMWNALVEQSAIDHPFLRFEWVHAWWACFAAGRQLHILVVREHGDIIAIAPLMQSRGSLYGIPVRRLEFIADVHTPRFDIIAAEPAGRACTAIAQYLERAHDDFDVVILPQLRGGAPTLAVLPDTVARRGLSTGAWEAPLSPVLYIRGAWDDYLATLDAKHRANLRNRQRRLEQLGTVQVETITGGADLPQAVEDGLRLEAAAWKGAAGTAIASAPEVRAFYTRVAEEGARQGWLQLRFLNLAGRRIAFAYLLHYRRRLYLLKQGYDPAFAAYSPFNLLCFLLLREAFASGVHAFEFLGTEEPWKRKWTHDAIPHRWLFLFPKRWRSKLLYQMKFRVVPRLRSLPFVRAAYARL